MPSLRANDGYRFAPLRDPTTEHNFAFSRRRCVRGLLNSLSLQEKREQGMPGACCTRGLVCKVRKKAHTSIQVQTEHSGIPCAMALRLMPCSPRRRIRLVTVVDGLTIDRKPGWVRTTSASLTPATGARTTRFCRTLQRRSSCATCPLTENRPAITHAPDAAASTATRPNVRDDGQRPSEWDRMATNCTFDLPDG